MIYEVLVFILGFLLGILFNKFLNWIMK